VGIVFGVRTRHLEPALWLVDAASIGLFTVTGIQRAVDAGLSIVPSLFLGVVTGTAGGLLRDVLCRETPTLLLPGPPHATASLFGGVVYLGADRFLGGHVWPEILALVAAFSLRGIGTALGWTIPRPGEMHTAWLRNHPKRNHPEE
jgi:uncharacterized membrane protein YeiH